MSLSRRSLLQYTGAGCALALLGPKPGTATTLHIYEVRDNVALPRFAAGARLVADASAMEFGGDGLYLYPAWGEPRLYAVRVAGTRLEFRNPGSGLLLWTQSATFEARFAGRVVDTEAATPVAAAFPPLAVPALPA